MVMVVFAPCFHHCLINLIFVSQPAESIALLVAFLKSGMPKGQIIRFLSVFSAMGPVGVALGMAVNEFAAPIVDAIMIAVVAGTFVYVGATEVIPEEWEEPEHKWKKFFALMSGIVSILVITQYTASLSK
jgi:solute carrier family 39 (zinc transporter), member 1/2/3